MAARRNIRGLVRVIAILACLSGAATAQLSLTTNFSGNVGQQGNMFDVKSLTGVVITGLDIHFTGTADFEVWAVTGGGTYVGNETSNANWTLQGTAPSLVSAGMNTPTPMGLALNIPIAAGAIQGLYVTAAPTGGAATVWYNSGVAQGSIHAANTDMEILVGNGGGYFNNTIVGRGWNGTIHYSPGSSFADDLAMLGIEEPNDSTGCDLLTTTETIKATFANYGSNAILAGSLVQLDLVIDGGPPITEFALLPADLLQGQSFQHTFTATADLSTLGSHTIDVTVLHPGDQDPSNDSKSKTVNSGSPTVISTFPYFENFDGAPAQNSTVPPTGWSQDTNDATGADSDWYMRTGNTTSSNTGPIQGDHTSGSGYYAYVEDSSGAHMQVNLDSPCFDLSGLSTATLSFWLFSFNGNPNGPNAQENFMSVDVLSYPGGAVTAGVFGPQGDLGFGSQAAAQWVLQVVDLTPFCGMAGTTIQVRFRGQSDNGGVNTFYHDQCIDDVSVFVPAPTPGQAPRPGLAVLDIENAFNANFVGVGSGQNGPYFTSVTQGGSFAFHIEGEAGQPIVVVYGALNPVSATYPGGIGQFDIGGPGVDPQGIPLNIGVFVNAIAWASNPVGFPLDALFFTDGSGLADIGFQMPNFGIPGGTVLTTFQSAITSSAAPFVYISNAIEVTIN